ncbi:hypothetical protein DM02DRAFT_580810 [Periconia macrospinosa]|uniref:Rhodopsin domain-containing protein n=1 Tax=Periconia macrospinosa TaxID=97972 RepID=A0A2V1EB96_9PLEO|nr:hypothetical protein DM02DRAFT_580810 [Periconia macrospinosa]
MAMELIYLGTLTLIKLSILFFYRRIISSVISRPILYSVWASIIFVAAYGISSMLALIFTCTPVKAYWYRFTPVWLKIHKYTCYDEVAYLVAVISISTLQDFITCLLPMFVVRKLRLPFRQKLALAAIFLLGLAVCATGALRVHYAHRVYYYARIHPSPTYDVSWDAFGSWVTLSVETNVGIICASAPALNTYFKGWLSVTGHEPRSFGWYRHKGKGWRPGRQRGGSSLSAPLGPPSWNNRAKSQQQTNYAALKSPVSPKEWVESL